ncbi:hypothetical protein COCOBI_15-4380 [Coccomyxa sp. Obi]|nr:hypothetical protein COCOBI_15-4380 [Coccomyxa sp. Obi]
MDATDRCLLRNQYTYPNSHQHISAVPIRPFQVHSDELEKCVCETHSTGRICPYHVVLSTIDPQERSAAMVAVVQSHDLVIEAGQLLLTTRAHTQNEDFERLGRLKDAVEASEEGAVLEKAAVKLIKAALLHGGLSMHIPLAPLSEFSVRTAYSGLAKGFGPCLAGQTAEQRARGLSWLHLVVSVPLIMWQARFLRSCQTAITTASVALALFAEEGKNWEPLLERHGLSLWDLELVLRMHQT